MNVLLAGVGNFGSWWASSCFAYLPSLKLYLYDPYTDNAPLIRSRTHELNHSAEIPSFSIYSSLSQIPIRQFDLIAVITNSQERLSVCQELKQLGFCSQRWLLDKILATNIKDLHTLSDLFTSDTVYVNHNRRHQPLWKCFRPSFPSLNKIHHVHHYLGAWELASNCFHFADLISYLFSTDLKSIKPLSQSHTWTPSSTRKNYFTLNGPLLLTYSSGLTFSMFQSSSLTSQLVFFDEGNSPLVVVDELLGTLSVNSRVLATCPLYNWSVLAPQILSDLIFHDKTDLPPLNHAIHTHTLLLSEFIKHWNATMSHQSINLLIS